MITSYHIERILGATDIVGYLAGRGFYPDLHIGGRYKFCCPIHQEDTPSFVVYPPTDEEPHQNFFCFGCKRGGSLISLKMYVEDITAGKAIRSLAEGIDISEDDALDYIVSEMKKKTQLFGEDTPAQISIKLSRRIHRFFQDTDFEEPYFGRAEKVLRILDDCVAKADVAKARDLFDMACEMLLVQMQKYENDKEGERRATMLAYSKIV